MTLFTWSTTANSNSTADASVNWAEGQAPSTVNNSSRALMAAAAKYRNDTSGQINSAGSADAYTFTSQQSYTSLQDGIVVTFRCNATNTGASTINVDSLGAKPLRSQTGTDLAAGVLVNGSIYTATYDSGDDEWLLHNFLGGTGLPAGSIIPYAGSTAPSNFLLCYGQAISRTTFSDLFAVLSTTYGAGDSSTTFNLPDLRGRVIAGQDDMGGTSANRLTNQTGGLDGDTLGATGGSETHTLTAAQLPAHAHTISFANRSGANDSGTGNIQSTNEAASQINDLDTQTDGGDDEAHNNIQPTIILNYIIKT